MRSEAVLLPNQDPWLTGKASEEVMPNSLMESTPWAIPSIQPCTSLPLVGMKISLGMLKGPTPPLVTAATRMEQVALVATTGSTATLPFSRTSSDTICRREEREENPGLGKAGKPGDLLRTVPLATFGAALLSQLRGSAAPGYLERRMALCARAGWDRERS